MADERGSPTQFRERLAATARLRGSWLCVGLDPDPQLAPPDLIRRQPDDWMLPFLRGIIEATSEYVCCYKPNLAFFEADGDQGLRTLEAVLKAVPAPVLTVGDAKRGDISNSAQAYARALFDTWGFDAVTVNPYMGGDSLEPFFERKDRGVFVVCKTSNPGSGEIQDLLVESDGRSEPLYQVVARRAQEWDQHGSLGLVVGATYPEEAAAIRRVAPDAPFLIPGIGAQAGDLERAVRASLDSHGAGALVNASRSVLYAERGATWQEGAHRAAAALRDQINAALQHAGATG